MATVLRGEIRVGGDKSVSHRAVMLAALARGTSRITNLSNGHDVNSTLRVYQQLGMNISTDNGSVQLMGHGFESLHTNEEMLYCGNSGTTLRLSLGILAGTQVQCRLAGDDSLNRRPVRRVIEPLTRMGGDLSSTESEDRPPVLVRGRRLHGINISTAIASAQVKSAILLAGLHAEGVTSVTEPDKSRDHTEIMLRHLGCNIDVEGKTAILSPAKKLDAFEYVVPGDVSTAMFFIVAALVNAGSELVVRDVLLNPTRTGALDILRAMGANIEEASVRNLQGERVGDLVVKSSQLKGCDTGGVAAARFIDEVPALAVAAMFAEGVTLFRNIAELRVKESDRALGIVNIIKASGGHAILDGETLSIGSGYAKQSDTADHLGDHRLAMMREIIDLTLSGKVDGGFADTIGVSAPEFYELLRGLLRR